MTTEAPSVVVGQWDGLEDGFHEADMTDYLAWPLVSGSGLSLIHRKTPARFYEALTAGEIEDDSAAKHLGTIVHTAVLEPDWLEAMFLAKPEPDPEKHRTADNKPSSNPANTKAYREEVAELEAKHPDKQLVDAAVYGQAMAMRDAIHQHKRASQIIKAEGPVEASAIFTDPETGVRCKIRPDKLVTALGAEVNLKSTRNARWDRFSWDLYRFGYYRTSALYGIGLKALGWDYRRSLIVAVESDGLPGPEHVAVYELDEGCLDAGEQHARMLLRRIARCFESGRWPGHGTEIESMSLPERAWQEIDDELRENP